ncbi:MAG TPA: c-type cytochrome [Gemmatimonadaceae bacterium]|nr:c-type cytochrome [Gemmatimonadaceae bacterium]
MKKDVSVITLVGIVALVVAGCQPNKSEGSSSSITASSTASSTASHSIDAGDSLRFVLHEENLPPGFPPHGTRLTITNPYEGNKDAIKTGGQLYVSYNCIDCHGADGSGAMAPTFQDDRWHFGGAPAAIFESIFQGRPDGMPAWGGRISNEQIWMLTAYVRSLSSGDITTENFTGKTVERTGH